MPVVVGGGACLGSVGGTGSDKFGFGLDGGGEGGGFGLTGCAEEDGNFGAAFSTLFGSVSLGFVSSGVGLLICCSGKSPAS